MRKPMYEVIFECTETLQNGKERRVKKSVFMPRYDENNHHNSTEKRIAKGTEALKEANYYGIIYIKTITTILIFG